MDNGFTTRMRWLDAPEFVRAAIAESVIGHRDLHGGMSPGPATLLELDTGERVVAKAVSAEANANTYRLYQWEAEVLRTLPSSVPAAKLRAFIEVGGWAVLVTSYVPGEVAGPPWTSDAVDAVRIAAIRASEHPAPDGMPPVIDRLPDLDGWLAVDPSDDWEKRYVPRLAARVEGWREWTAGSALVHLDVRCDNAIVHAGQATLIDWAYAAAGAWWLDQALLAADIVGSGHAQGKAVVEALRVLDACPPEAAAYVIAVAGMWRRNSTLAPVPALPTFRRWQRTRADALRPLLERLLS
jgi:hypothetical protein